MIRGSEKIRTVSIKEVFTVEILCKSNNGNIKSLGFFHDMGYVNEFSTYNEAYKQILSFVGLHPKNYIYSINKYFKLCSD